jgi:hypothetical protein
MTIHDPAVYGHIPAIHHLRSSFAADDDPNTNTMRSYLSGASRRLPRLCSCNRLLPDFNEFERERVDCVLVVAYEVHFEQWKEVRGQLFK